jgi:hypothetical protein
MMSVPKSPIRPLEQAPALGYAATDSALARLGSPPAIVGTVGRGLRRKHAVRLEIAASWH